MNPGIKRRYWYRTSPTRLLYRASGGWIEKKGRARAVPGTDRVVHTVILDDLPQNTTIEFRLPDTPIKSVYTTYNNDATATLVIHWHTDQLLGSVAYNIVDFGSEIYSSYTLPKNEPDDFKLAQISDSHGNARNIPMMQDLGQMDCDLIVHSGDVATGDGGASSPYTWYVFFDAMNEARKPDGRIIPILPCIGNHEILNGANGRDWGDVSISKYHYAVGRKPDFERGIRGDAEWYYCFFPTWIDGYKVIDAGDWLSVWMLDPGISTPLKGDQTDWLLSTTQERNNVRHRFYSLHYSPWHLGRRFQADYHNGVRENWCPIWENNGVKTVLVGHDHVMGYTVKIKGGEHYTNDPNVEPESGENPDGVRYVGAGPFGAGARSGRNQNTKWWIELSKPREYLYYNFESNPSFNDPNNDRLELRNPHPDDDTPFDTDNEAIHWWMIDLYSDKRIFNAVNRNGNIFHTFEDDVDYQ